MAFPFIFCPKKAEFLDFERMFSFPNTQFSSVVNSEISALFPIAIDGFLILKTSLLAVNLLTTTSSGKIVSVSGILGVIFDRDALGVSNLDRRVTTNYNPRAEFYTNFYKFDAGYYNDLSENFVLFFIG